MTIAFAALAFAAGWILGAAGEAPRKLRTGVIRSQHLIRVMREKGN